ncbi:MAG: Fmu (Sun) domain-containing protein [Chitinophagaceae bacterium]|nr:Fmu (Sun) domain-containing protein [Chitinophagaceae bacterium]
MLASYSGAGPFSSFIKKHFSSNKKFGSRDRKTIAHLCYCYFRLGKSLEQMNTEERILLALFLCASSTNEILQQLKPEWNEKVESQFDEKLKLLNLSFDYKEIFPFADELSDGIEVEQFCRSHLVQPDLFLRIRPGMKEIVLNKLKKAAIDFEEKGDACIALSNATKIDEVFLINKEVVVQDWSSQRVGEFITSLKSKFSNKKISAWDCCAASGGKSIMLFDLFPNVELTVSDIRDSILVNLQNRFAEAGINKYNSLVLDLSTDQLRNSMNSFDFIIADVPCSGSGTWGRTPENLRFFNRDQIDKYVSLQKSIMGNCIPSLKPNGYLLYITCSVFKKENEEVVKFLQEQHQLQVVEQRIIKGYDVKADTMFAALLKKV